MPQSFDYLVLGGGIAGLSFALEASPLRSRGARPPRQTITPRFRRPRPGSRRIGAWRLSTLLFGLMRAVLFVSLIATSAWPSGIYKYVESDGTIVYTNVPPGKKPLQARRIDGEFRPAPTPLSPAKVTDYTKKA